MIKYIFSPVSLKKYFWFILFIFYFSCLLSPTDASSADVDVDKSAIVDATDGVLILRRLNGGSTIDTGVVLPVGRSNAKVVSAIDALGLALDVDHSGTVDATDGVLILRRLNGGSTIDTGVVLPPGESNTTVVAAIDQIATIPQYYTNSFGMTFRLIPAGTFTMGSPSTENGRYIDEGPQHTVTISKAFYMQTTEMTQGQWKSIKGANSTGNNPSLFTACGDNCPVENVSWSDLVYFLLTLNSKKEGNYRLPTEAQWEYAARAGTTTPYSFGEDASQVGNYAWYKTNADSKTHPVATKLPNPWGLYDMYGNLWELVFDPYSESYPNVPMTDPPNGTVTVSTSSDVVMRGGGYTSNPDFLRSAVRLPVTVGKRYDNVGFRLVRDY
ncbi:MAG: SUMF1/EgtB/PvdO family nonheme iron enzyme [Magnetococcus sp. YQC-5]